MKVEDILSQEEMQAMPTDTKNTAITALEIIIKAWPLKPEALIHLCRLMINIGRAIQNQSEIKRHGKEL